MPPRTNKKAPPKASGPCPNPHCSGHGKFFANLNKHIGQKQDCLEFMLSLRQQVVAKALACENKTLPMSTTLATAAASVVATTIATHQQHHNTDESPDFPITANDDDDAPYQDAPLGLFPPDEEDFDDDFEQHNYNLYMCDEDADNMLFNTDPTAFTNARRAEVTLLKILTELDAPLWAFRVIMDWAFDAHQSGYDFMPSQKTYRGQLHTISQWVGMAHMRPQVIQVPLPGKRPDDVVPVTTFDFISQFHSLLSDKELNTDANLVVNTPDPFTQYTPPDGLLHECLSGSWYRNAWQHMETQTECNFMIPIILYIDKTQMSISGKLSLFPVQMSLSIFTEETRRTSRAWRPLGYIANEEYYFSAAERDVNDANTKNERFHTQLHEILRSFKDAQEPGALHGIPIQLGTSSKLVNLYVPLQFIIGDVEGGDQLCSRWTYRGTQCRRLCRTCDVSTENSARTDIQCTRIRVADIQHLVANADNDELKAMAQRPGFNALYTIDCGNDPYGVFSMIHTEGLHALEVGLIPYMLEILFNDIPNARLPELDILVKHLLRHPKQHGYDCFPRLLWQDGVTSIKQLTGDLKVGKMFAIVVAALTREGETFFTECLTGGLATWRKMVYVFQQILCYWTWLKRDKFWMATDHAACAAATQSIKLMMQQIQDLWPRNEGLCWSLTKLHEQFHVPVDIHRHGNHKNVHTGPQEHNHIQIKDAAKKTQMNKKTLDIQTGWRVMERLVIQRAYDFIFAGKTEDITLHREYDPTKMGSKGRFLMAYSPTMADNCARLSFVWNNVKYSGIAPMYQNEIMELLFNTFFDDHAVPGTAPNELELDIPFYTEYERNGFLYRAHPKYRGEHPYYDWAFVQWVTGTNPVTNEDINKSYPARILGFIRNPNGMIDAIVHSVKEPGPRDDNAHGVFGSFWEMEQVGPAQNKRPLLRLVSVDSLLEHACMIPYSAQHPFTWFHILQRSEWSDCFHPIQ